MNLKEALMRAYVAGWECVDDTDEDKTRSPTNSPPRWTGFRPATA